MTNNINRRRRRRYVRVRNLLIEMVEHISRVVDKSKLETFVESLVIQYPMYRTAMVRFLRNSSTVILREMSDMLEWAKSAIKYVKNRLNQREYSGIEKLLMEQPKIAPIYTFRPIMQTMSTVNVSKFETVTGSRFVPGYLPGILEGEYYRALTSFLMASYFKTVKNRVPIMLYAPDHAMFVARGYDVLPGEEMNVNDWDEELRNNVLHARGLARERLANFNVIRIVLENLNVHDGRCVLIVPWKSFDFKKALNRSANSDLILILPVFKRGATSCCGLTLETNGDYYLFIDPVSSEVVVELERSVYDDIVYRRKHANLNFVEKGQVGELMMLMKTELTVSTPWLEIKDNTHSVLLHGNEYENLYSAVLNSGCYEDEDVPLKIMVTIRSFDFGLSDKDILLISKLLCERVTSQVLYSTMRAKLNHRPDLWHVMHRYMKFALYIGKTIYSCINFVNHVSTGLPFVFNTFERYIRKTFNDLFHSVDWNLFNDVRLLADNTVLNGIEDVPLVYIVYSEIVPFRLSLNSEAEKLMDKFETTVGATKHMRDFSVRVTARQFLLDDDKTKVKGENGVNNLINNVVTRIDPDYQLSHPRYHLLLRASIGIDFDTDALHLKMKFRTQDWVQKPMIVHLSKAGEGEMIRRMNVDNAMDALISRNLGVVHQGEIMDWDRYVSDNYFKFADVVFRPDYLEYLSFFKKNQVAIDPRSMMIMSKTMTPSKYAKYMDIRLKSLESSDTSELLVILKQRVKEQVIHRKLGVSQTVFFLEPEDALAWLLFCKELIHRQELLFDERIVTGDMKSDEEICDRLAAHIPMGSWGKMDAHMADQSQFDKSEIAGATAIERICWRHLGVPELLLNKWFSMNYRVRTRFMTLGIKLTLAEMRRSGHPITLSSNTLVTIFSEVVTKGYIRKQVLAIWVQGDDIWVLLANGAHVNLNASLLKASIFNLIEKTEVFKYAWYNCSRFLVQVGNKLRIVYDPVKMCAKFVRPLTTHEYGCLDERFDSYKLLCSSYSDPRIVEALIPAMAEMHGFKSDVTRDLMRVCTLALSNKDIFKSIWFDNPVRI